MFKGMKNRGSVALGLACGVLFAAPAAGAQDDFLSRFAGSWSGSGTVQRNVDASPNKVSCKVKGSGAAESASISGSCSAAIVFSRQIGADLRFDPASGRYTGTYTGSRHGPSALSGKRSGDSLNLVVTWPREVNGDRKANMTISNAGKGRFSLVVTDEVEGKRQTTTNVSFAKR